MHSPLTSPSNPSIPQSKNPPVPLLLQPLPLSALAALLGCTRSTIRHFADRLGFRYTIRRMGPRGQRLACLTPDQAQLIASELERESSASSSSFEAEAGNREAGGWASPSSSSMPSHSEATAGSSSSPAKAGAEDSTPSANPTNPLIQQSNNPAEGHFYLLQLEPKHDPGRFKLGFSSDLDSRLDDLRTVVPLARLIAAWPAQRSWERTAIISTSQNAEPLSQEVFRAECLEDIVAAGDRFFAVMPKLSPSPLPLPLPPAPPSPNARRADPRCSPALPCGQAPNAANPEPIAEPRVFESPPDPNPDPPSNISAPRLNSTEPTQRLHRTSHESSVASAEAAVSASSRYAQAEAGAEQTAASKPQIQTPSQPTVPNAAPPKSPP